MPAQEFKNLGVIPYQRTGKELRLASAPVGLPVGVSTYQDDPFFNTTVLMQSQSPECGGFSLGFALEYLDGAPKLSGSFSYAYEKTVDGVPDTPGTTIEAVGEAAQNAGSCLYDLFPDDGTQEPFTAATPFSEASPEAKSDGLLKAGWIKVYLDDLSWQGIQNAILKYKVVLVEAKVGNEWWTSQYGKVIPVGQTSWNKEDILPIKPPATVIDSHFFVLGGRFNPTEIWFANSWSPEWGAAGFGYFGPDYIPFIQNAFILYKVPPSVQLIQNHQQLTPIEKTSLIQQIINDLEGIVTDIKAEIKS